jgi:hypothetical protein
MEENTTLKDEVRKLNENFSKLMESEKVKGVKLRKSPSKSKVKNNYIYVLYIQDNGEIKPMSVQVEEGTTAIDGIPRLATSEYRLTYKGKPAIIQPSWSVKPFSPVDHYEETVKEQMASQGYRLLLNRLEQGKLKAKKKLSGAAIFFIIIALIVIGYLAMQGLG